MSYVVELLKLEALSSNSSASSPKKTNSTTTNYIKGM
jgi:hypothetical protein